MNTKFVLASVFAAVSGLAGIANTASAGTDIHLNIGIGARPGPVIVAPRYAPVVVVPASPAYGYGHGRPAAVPVYRDACPPPAPRGFWKEVSVKVWVPAEWTVSRGHHGRDVRTLRPGYYTYRTDRVWVADTGHHGGSGHGRGDHGHGRG